MASTYHVVPELILYEERHLGLHQTEEACHIARGVHWQIAHNVGTLIVLAHLVARRTEEGEQYLVLGMLAAEAFHERASLLKLSQGCGMEPHIALALIYLPAQGEVGLQPSLEHGTGLAVERGHQDDAQHIEVNGQGIHVSRESLWRDSCDGGSRPCPGRLPVHTCRGLVRHPPGRCARHSRDADRWSLPRDRQRP